MSDERVRITPTVDGPLEVVGPVTITASDGTTIRETDKVYLCRCGSSQRKPFCDGSHKRVEFTSTVEP